MRPHFLLILGVLMFLGCGGASGPDRRAYTELAQQEAAGEPVLKHKAAGAKEGRAQERNAEAQEVARKIIYTARVDLGVEDFEKSQKELSQLIEEQKGYVANSEVRGSSGTPRFGTWTVRVPVANFRKFLTEVERLGVAQKSTTDSQDVTDEFYDLEARLKTMKAEEESLQELLKKTTGKMEDILSVRRELSRVRGDIEQAQGRLQKLTKLTDLTTVTITIQERKDYEPAGSPSFGTTIGRTFGESLEALLSVGRGVVLVLTALVPWVPVLAVIGVSIWLFVRRYGSRRSPGRPPEPPTVLPAEPIPPVTPA